jgi:hypothetical protein
MRLPRTRIVLVIAAALAVAVFGLTRLIAALNVPAAATAVATVQGVTASVTTVGWVDMDHDMTQNAPGYQMPPAMMPGMPDQGKERLMVDLAMSNDSNDTRPLRPGQEFTLHAGKDGTAIKPQSDSFGELPRLAAHNAVNGVIYFDLPPADLTASPAWIEWAHGGTTTRLSLPLNGVPAAPNHQHSS